MVINDERETSLCIEPRDRTRVAVSIAFREAQDVAMLVMKADRSGDYDFAQVGFSLADAKRVLADLKNKQDTQVRMNNRPFKGCESKSDGYVKIAWNGDKLKFTAAETQEQIWIKNETTGNYELVGDAPMLPEVSLTLSVKHSTQFVKELEELLEIVPSKVLKELARVEEEYKFYLDMKSTGFKRGRPEFFDVYPNTVDHVKSLIAEGQYGDATMYYTETYLAWRETQPKPDLSKVRPETIQAIIDALRAPLDD